MGWKEHLDIFSNFWAQDDNFSVVQWLDWSKIV